MAQNGPGKPNKPADDGFSDTAGNGPAEDDAATSSSWLESGESSGMFAETAAAPDALGYEVRSHEGSTDGEEVAMQDRARDASADAYADAYEQATTTPDGPDVEPPVLAEAADAPDPYEFKDDGVEANSWVDAEPVRSWTPEDDFAPAPELLNPDTPLEPLTSTASEAAAPVKPAPRPAPVNPPRPSGQAPRQTGPVPRPTGPRPSGPLPRPAGQAPPAKAPSGPVKTSTGVPPRPTASGPIKPPTTRPPGATPAPTLRPDAGTPKPGSGANRKGGGLDLDNLFKRAKDIKKDEPKK